MSSIDSEPKITMNTPVAAALRCSLIFLVSAVAYADSAQWNLNPASGDWNTTANWTPIGVPNGPADMATFALSNTTNVSISEDTEVNGIIFTSVATNLYTVTASPELTLTISGVGIKNNSGIAQKFVTAVDGSGNFGRILFTTSTTAESCIFTNDGSTFASRGGSTEFYDSSTAVNASFTNRSGSGTGTSATIFFDTSTAANGTFTNEGGGTGGTPFAEGGQTIFFDASTAGNGIFTNNGATASGGFGGDTVFDDNSSAGNGSFTNNGGTASGVAAFGGGATFFFGTSTAANGIFINNAAPASGAEGGVTEFGLEFFNFSPSAGNGTFINNGATISGAVGGETIFNNASTADAATLIANGGTNGGEGGAIFFQENSTGTARIEVFGNGILDVSGHNSPGVTIGSIEGEGDVFLGTNNLAVGSNNLSTSFFGVIQDGGFGASMTKIDTATLGLTEASSYNGEPRLDRGVLKVYDSISTNPLVIQDGGLAEGGVGSLTKIGSGTLDLEGVNRYTGDTIINGGVLQIDGSILSNTFVNRGGTLAGSGTVNGNITNRGGKISPGEAIGVPGVLTVGGNYTTRASQIAGGTLSIQIGGGNVGQVSVLDVQDNANLGGLLDPVLVNGFVPEIGQSFTFLNYASFTGFFRIRKPVFDHGRKRWSVAYGPTSAALIAVENHHP
jgi:autotransporter-associated beta strand protein